MKTAGIVVDNYKVEKFKKELIAKGFTDFKVVPFTKDTSTIFVKFEEHQLKELTKLIKTVNFNCKNSN